MQNTTSDGTVLLNKDLSRASVDALAIQGGVPVRSKPLPARHAIGERERALLNEALDWYQLKGLDPGYQGKYEELYCQTFSQFQGGGFADVVATGTLSLLVALLALELPKNSEVLVSPITDPGTLSAIIYAGLKPKLIDSQPNSFNVGLQQIADRITQNTSCLLIVHAAGKAIDLQAIVELCLKRGIKILEDCSQSHGASFNGKKVGTFGDIAAFSTMYRKNSITGSCGGVAYTQDQNLYHNALAYADRGKPRWIENFDDRDPNHFLFPALNLHSNELACAIGIASLKRLPDTIQKRLAYALGVSQGLKKYSEICSLSVSEEDSPFYCPIFVESEKLNCSKIEFAKAIQAEGIGLNPHYQYLVQDWPWLKPYLVDDFECENARHARDNIFCLYLNENYAEEEVQDTLKAILKVERNLKK